MPKGFLLQPDRLKIAIQKQGRLNNEAFELLVRCGIQCHMTKNALFVHVENMPIDIIFIRDNDIPTLVMEGICDLGIVGENTLLEKTLSRQYKGLISTYNLITALGFGKCRLSIAVPKESPIEKIAELDHLRIATRYSFLLQRYLTEHNMSARLFELSGSVEIAPKLGMADAICDVVSTGRTLEDNHLKEFVTILTSQAVLIQSQVNVLEGKKEIIARFCRLIESEKNNADMN